MSTDAQQAAAIPGTDRRDLVRDGVSMLSSANVATVLGVVVVFVVRRFVEPSLIGIWTSTRRAIEYGTYSSLGANRAAAREIAVAAGRGDAAGQRRAADAAMTIELATGAIVAIGFAIAGAVCAWRGAGTWPVACFAAAVIAVVSRYHGFVLTALRSHKKFAVLARARMFGAVADALLLAGGAYLLAFRGDVAAFCGMIGGAVAAHVFNACYARAAGGLRFAMSRDRAALVALVAAGWPMAAEAAAMTVLRSIDQWIVLWCLPRGAEQLGWYGISVIMGSWCFDQAMTVANVMFPRLGETLGRTGDATATLRLGLRTAEIVALALTIGAAALLGFGVPIIGSILPKYRPGLVASTGLVAAALLLGVSIPLRHALVTIGRSTWMLVATVTSVGVSLTGGLFMIERGGGLAEVAWMSAAAAAACLVMQVALCVRRGLLLAAVRVLGAAGYGLIGVATIGAWRGELPFQWLVAATWCAVPALMLVQMVDWSDLLKRRHELKANVDDVTDPV